MSNVSLDSRCHENQRKSRLAITQASVTRNECHKRLSLDSRCHENNASPASQPPKLRETNVTNDRGDPLEMRSSQRHANQRIQVLSTSRESKDATKKRMSQTIEEILSRSSQRHANQRIQILSTSRESNDATINFIEPETAIRHQSSLNLRSCCFSNQYGTRHDTNRSWGPIEYCALPNESSNWKTTSPSKLSTAPGDLQTICHSKLTAYIFETKSNHFRLEISFPSPGTGGAVHCIFLLSILFLLLLPSWACYVGFICTPNRSTAPWTMH